MKKTHPYVLFLLAKHKLGNQPIERFVYDAYFYAERRVSVSQLLREVDRLLIRGELSPVVEDYVFDILGKGVRPLELKRME